MVLGSQQNQVESTESSHIPSTPPPTTWTFVTINEPILTLHYHPKSIVYIRIHSWRCTFLMGFHNCMMTRIHPCSIIQYRFALKILRALPIHPSLTPGNH